jgi:polyhydroxyalkanoate synthase
VGSLRDAGHAVWLLDWDFGAAGPALALEHLAGAVAWASTEVRSVTGAPPAAVVGYCLGATIALLREAAWPSGEPLVLIAPVVAASPDSGMGRLLGHPRFHPLLALDAGGRVPASLVRFSFHWLRPRALRTVRTWTGARRDPRLAQGYAAMARWVWDHQDLPGGILLDVVDLYRQGGLAQGWNVNGAPVSLAAVDGPVLVVCASRDHIVPPSSSTALLDLAGDRVEVLEVDSGHVGMLVNLGSGEILRPALLAWLAQARPPALRPSARRRSPAG